MKREVIQPGETGQSGVVNHGQHPVTVYPPEPMTLRDALFSKFRYVVGQMEVPDTAIAVIDALCADKDTVHITLSQFCEQWADIIQRAQVEFEEDA